MVPVHALAMNSTVVRNHRKSASWPDLARLAGTRLGLRGLCALTPGMATLVAEQLFLSPPRPRGLQHRFFDFLEARFRPFEFRGRRIALWQWGADDAPAVLLAHGWGGASTQMRGFVHPLLAAGYRVLAWDQPAHGLSAGRLTGLPELSAVAREIQWRHEGAVAAIGLSLGAIGLAAAVSTGTTALERLVLIGAPTDLVGHSRRFARMLGLPESLRRRMQSATEERFGEPWSRYTIEAIAPRLRGETLIVHGRRDRIASPESGTRLASSIPGARLRWTEGGHFSMLGDSAVVDDVVDFVVGRSAVTAPANPALPNPAPLY